MFETRVDTKFCFTKFCKISQHETTFVFGEMVILFRETLSIWWHRSGSCFKSNQKTQKRATVTRVYAKLGEVCELDPGHVSKQIEEFY
jgi:hypothetical protein